MPSPARPVLAVDFTAFSNVDATDPQNLCETFLVFTKSAISIDRGPRLENLNLERSSSEQGDQKVSVTQSVRTGSLEDVPPLSSSVDSENRDKVAKSTLPKNLKTQPSEEHHSYQSLSPETNHCTTVVRGFLNPQIQIVYHDTASSKITFIAANPEPSLSPVAEHKIAQVGGSFEEDTSTKDSVASQRSSLSTGQMKTSSHADRVLEDIINDNSAIDDDSDTDYVDESAIDDDDDSNWEDSTEDSSESSSKSSINEDTFQHFEPDVNLTSRCSLISLMIAQKRRSGDTLQPTSGYPRPSTVRPATPIQADSDGNSDALLMMRNGRSVALRIPMSAKPNDSKVSTSPRTTRSNMLATELTESLRRNLLWERQQKSSTANAVLQRHHTSHDVTNLKQYPEKARIGKNEDAPVVDWWQSDDWQSSDYHDKGW